METKEPSSVQLIFYERDVSRYVHLQRPGNYWFFPVDMDAVIHSQGRRYFCWDGK